MTTDKIHGRSHDLSGRFEEVIPKNFRLARKKNAPLILQGEYFWQEVDTAGHLINHGCEWREIPIVDLEE